MAIAALMLAIGTDFCGMRVKKQKKLNQSVKVLILGGIVAIYSFFQGQGEVYSSMSSMPDHRTDMEKTSSPLALHQNSADFALVERYAEETINISGAWVEVYLRTDDGGWDEVWDEEADPSYHDGFDIKGFFEPQPVKEDLTKWGIDNPNKITIVFARSPLLNKVGKRLLRPGDIIKTPQNSLVFEGMRFYRVLNATDSGMYHYRYMYLSVVSEVITGDVSLRVKNALRKR